MKAVGAGHSFTAAAMTDGVLMSLDGVSEVESIDRETGRITVGAGMRLFQLNEVLAAQTAFEQAGAVEDEIALLDRVIEKLPDIPLRQVFERRRDELAQRQAA